MTRPMVSCCLLGSLLVVSSLGWTALQTPSAKTKDGAVTEREESPEEQRERQIQERFIQLLKRSPRFGTALDRVYGYHVERGTLDKFIEKLQEEAKQDDSDGTEWMLLGLFEYQRGNDGQAVEAFTKAEDIRDDDPLASYYLGRAYLLLGDDQKAAKAYERALAREPKRIDLMEIFQGLGRIYQRAQDQKKASEVWARLEKLFPDDTQVLEEIAYIIAEEGDYEGALNRYRKLADEATEPYRRVQYEMQAGKMLVRLNRMDDAVELFEATLKRLKPESWLHRDVRRQIEDVFLATDDYNGLTKYYEKWLEKHDEDIEAMGRLAHILAVQGRLPEAQQWYARAIKLSPSNTDLRESLISRLIDAAKYEQAIAQYEQLEKIDPGNPDYIEKWGQLVFENPDGDKQTQAADAAKIWRKMLDGHEDDPVLVTRVADLLRYAELTDEAIALYKEAIDLAPNNSQYREYLGEYYHILERTDEAKETWKQIAAGPRRNQENLVRLAEVYAGFGFDDDALSVMKAACELDPEFADRLQYAVMLTDAEEFEEAHRQLDLAREMAENDEELDNVLRQRINAFLAANQLQDEIDKLQARLDGPEADSGDGWRRMAVYLQAISRADQAVSAIERSLALDANSIRTLSLAAALYESVGRLGASVETYRKLSNLDRQYRSEYLQKIASLEMRLGRTDNALAAGEELIASAPGNPENYSFYADLCFRLGKTDQGLDSLRRAVRANPSDPAALLTLAQALANQFRTPDAIELYWQAFEKSELLEDKLNVISNLTELYLRTGHFDRLVEKLEIKERQGSENRDITICIAAAYKNLGDFVKSREILEQLLTEENRDVTLLQELVSLSNSANDYEDAARYQRRILELSPTSENEVQLAQILLQTGEMEEAEALWTKLVAAEQDEYRVFRSLDEMIRLDRSETALAILDKLLRDDADNWEALYRKGITLWKLDKKEESLAAFQKLTDLHLDDDEPSSGAKHLEQQRKQRGTSSSSASYLQSRRYPPVVTRSQAFYNTQRILSNDSRMGQTRWSPDDYGQARVAALVVRFQNAQSEGNPQEFLAKLEKEIEQEAEKNPRKLWDLYYLRYANRRPETQYLDHYKLCKRLSQTLDDDAAKYVYLSSLRLRNYNPNTNPQTAQENAEPLADDEITHMLDCFEQVYHSHPDWLSSASVVHSVSTELRIAGKEERADELYQQLVQEAQDEQALGTAMQVAATAGNIDDVLELARKGEEQFSSSGRTNVYQNYRYQAFYSLLQKLITENRFDDVKRLLSAQFEHQKRRYLSLPVYRRSQAQQSNNPIGVTLSTGGRRRSETITYPTPNPFFDQQDIIFAYTAFDGFKTNQKGSDLIEALTAEADSDTDLDEVISRLGLAYAKWWIGEQSAAMQEIETVAKLYPDEPFLQLQLIDVYYRSKRYKEALQIVNELRAADRKLLEQREIIALKLAVQVGDLDRAREAAKHLFGMNLKSDLQLQLAAQMNQLGMHELGDAVLARTRRRAGNRSNTLIQLMQQYAAKGNNDVANQIAMQIIRRTSPASTTSGSSQQRAEASYRASAIQQLNKTGELDKLIARLEEQLKSSPDSQRLNETLLDYYQSAGRTKEAEEIVKKLRANLPDNPALLATQARKLYSARDYKGACDLYLKVIELKPEMLDNEYYNIQRSFDQAKRHDDLIKAFLTVDMSKLQNSYYRITEMVNWIAQLDNGKRVDDAVKIFQRAWEALPQYRQYMLTNLYATQLWSNEVIYDYSREILIPGEKASLTDPWMGLENSSHSVSSNGTTTGILSRTIAGIAKNEERRKQFLEEVAAAGKTHPKWLAGTAYLAIFDAKAGETEKARAAIKGIFDDKANHPSSPDVSWMIASELGNIDGMEQTALDILQTIDLQTITTRYSSSSIGYDPRRLMVTLYQKTGESKQARDLLFAMFESRDYSRYSGSNPGYAEYQTLRDVNTLSQLLVQMNFVIDAVRLLEDTLANDAQFAAASRWGGSNYKQRLQTALQNARKKLTPELLQKSLADWLPDPEAKEYTGTNLMVSVQPETIESATLKSLFEDSLLTLHGNKLSQAQQSGQSPPVGREPLSTDSSSQQNVPKETSKDTNNKSDSTGPTETIATLQKQLDQLETRWPDVLTFPAIRVLLLQPAPNKQDEQAKVLEKLLAAVETHRNSLGEQKTAAEQLVAIWLVARKALQSPEHQAAGETLASFVIDSTETIDEPKWVAAILRERGQIALDAGDREEAEKYWTLLLAHILKTETQLGNKTTSTGRSTIRSATVALPAAPRP